MKGRKPALTGIHRHGSGWRAIVSRGRDRPPVRRQFPADTSPETMQAWRADERARQHLSRKQRASMGTFEGDARRYLQAVTGLESYQQRVRDIDRWIGEFGTRERDTIASSDIRGIRDRWLTEPRSDIDPRPVSPATINKRLRALSNLWTVLDGPRADNPVRDVPEFPERTSPPRALDYGTIDAIIAAMPDGKGGLWKQAKPYGHAYRHPSVSKVRVRILAETGLSLSTLKRLTRRDVDTKQGLLYVPPRKKGRGADGVVLPLTPGAIAAFADLDRLKGWGAFNSRSLRYAFTAACEKVGIVARLHDLRHGFLTALALASMDEGAVQAIAQHGDARTTRRYITASVNPRIAGAMAAFQVARLSQTVVPRGTEAKSGEKLARHK